MKYEQEIPYVNLRNLAEMDQYNKNLFKIPKTYSQTANLRYLNYQLWCNTDKSLDDAYVLIAVNSFFEMT